MLSGLYLSVPKARAICRNSFGCRRDAILSDKTGSCCCPLAMVSMALLPQYPSGIGLQAGCQNPFTDYRFHSSQLTQDNNKRMAQER